MTLSSARRKELDALIAADKAARFSGALQARQATKAKRGPQVYIITAAQNNTHVHAELWRNLLAYTKARGARLIVSQFTYNKAAYGERDVKPGTKHEDDYDKLWYASEILPHRCNERFALTKSLMLAGEVNISPTAERPLSGFENYTGRSSGIFPHVKQHMQSIPSLTAAKFNYTTGACTLRNYLQKKAGLKGEYQHAYGALIVEVDADGSWFVRQLRATEDGSFQDLDATVRDGLVSHGNRIEGIQWGDIHVAQMDPEVRKMNWGEGGILDALKPRYQFMHDTLDFKSRNHHESRDPHEQFRKWKAGIDSVERELRHVAVFLRKEASRDFCKTVVVDSNHDAALTRWLREADYKNDPANAEIYLKLQASYYKAIAAGDDDFNLLASVLRQMDVAPAVKFLKTDESFVICKPAGGIECGMHGDRGPNGARGSALAFARMSRRTNTGHSHSAGIYGDAFVSGTCSLLRMSYNKGPSSWSHSHIVTYANGCRAIVTCWRGRWRGGQNRDKGATKALRAPAGIR